MMELSNITVHGTKTTLLRADPELAVSRYDVAEGEGLQYTL